MNDLAKVIFECADELANDGRRRAFFESSEIMEQVMRVDPVLHAIAKANLDTPRRDLDRSR